jgi:hypothetical protein
MAVTAFWYGLALKDQWGTTSADRVDFATDTIKTSLHTSTYSPAQDTDNYWDDATNEVSSTNYTSGGVTLASKTLTYTAGTNVVAFDAADAAWTTVTFTTRYAVVYKSTGTSSTSHLFSYVDFGADQTVSSGNFTVVWAAGGIATITAS